MAIEIIKEEDAPAVPIKAQPKSDYALEIAATLQKLSKGGVAKVPVPEGKEAKGVRIGIGRIASNMGMRDQFITYEPDPPDNFVYIRKKPRK